MATLERDIEQLKYASLEGLDQSQEALIALQEDCRKAAELLSSDLVQGSLAVADVASLIHDFLTFEQEIIHLFDIDPSQIVDESDSLAQVENDMSLLLASFDEKMEAMDLIGTAELFRKPIPALLLRFQKLLPVVRDFVYDFING